MEDQVMEAVNQNHGIGGQFREQLDRMREFRDRMQQAGAASSPEQFAVRPLEPIEPRRSIAISKFRN